MIKRFYEPLSEWIPEKRALLIYGPRRVGKTTLVEQFAKRCGLRYRLDSGDNIRIRELLGSSDFQKISDYVSGYELIIIDEAQNIEGIGKGLKILVDQHPELQIIATGSSSFSIQQQVGEPLTGRKRELTLFPISLKELEVQYNRFDLDQQLDNILIYGLYPEVYAADSQLVKVEYLDELVDSYLLKDILTLDKLKNSDKLLKIVSLLAFQVGSEVSIHELSQKVGLDVKTVDRYIDLLEKSFVVYKLTPFSRNLRNEIAKKSKYYFYDNGIRNAIIKQYNSMNLRNDQGQLWENFLMSERLKKIHYERMYLNRFFWRTYQQKEIDYIEEIDGNLYAYEFKYQKKKAKTPLEFTDAYKPKEFRIIHRENYLDFVL
jgi:predicted AAA+ superfamily ATPase